MKVKGIVYSVLLLALIGGGLWVWFWMQGEAVGTVGTGVAKEKVEEVKSGTEVYTGTYFKVDVPRSFGIRSKSLPESGPVKETVFFVGTASNNEKVAITVEERPENTFESSPGFELRKQDREYLQKKIKNEEQEINLFSKASDPYEKTVYFFQDAFLVSISYTATAEKDEAEGQILQMQKTFKILSVEERQKQEEKKQEGLQ
ncbi:MAG: hypothetical protein KIH67_000290 [Candidatus Moranbacteria bacterium]|nr:hypothetical protein [Candidatus Moranbacteria bacterium]